MIMEHLDTHSGARTILTLWGVRYAKLDTTGHGAEITVVWEDRSLRLRFQNDDLAGIFFEQIAQKLGLGDF